MTQEQWIAIRNNDKRYDGVFYYALKTTGVVCRPSCTSRRCKPQNVIIYDTLEDALAHGFRPCLRCRPDQPDWRGAKAELVQSAKALILQNYTEKFSLKNLASTLFVNENYLVRVFREITGHTMLWYHNSVRCAEAARLLTSPELSVSDISWRVGYASPSHFARVFKKMHGVTPTEYRKNYLQSLNEIP